MGECSAICSSSKNPVGAWVTARSAIAFILGENNAIGATSVLPLDGLAWYCDSDASANELRNDVASAIRFWPSDVNLSARMIHSLWVYGTVISFTPGGSDPCHPLGTSAYVPAV